MGEKDIKELTKFQIIILSGMFIILLLFVLYILFDVIYILIYCDGLVCPDTPFARWLLDGEHTSIGFKKVN